MESISAISDSVNIDHPHGTTTIPIIEPPPPPLSDEDAITLHVTNLLAVDNSDVIVITKTLGLLRVILSSTHTIDIQHKKKKKKAAASATAAGAARSTSSSVDNRTGGGANDDDDEDDVVNVNRRTAFRRGAHVAVVYVMRRHLADWQIQNDALGILVSLCRCKFDTRIQRDIVAVGGLTACLEAMRTHIHMPNVPPTEPEEPEEHQQENNQHHHHVQAIGCCLIANLWCTRSSSSSSHSSLSSSNLQKMVLDQGGLLAVVRAMEQYENDAQVQYRACRALYVLLRKKEPLEPSSSSSDNNTSVARAVVDAGGIRLVVAAMNHHVNDVKIQINGCEFLSALAKMKRTSNNEEEQEEEPEEEEDFYRDLILDAKGLGAIVEARRIHKDNVQVKMATRNALKVIS